MRSFLVLAALVFALLLAAGVNILMRGPGNLAAAQRVAPDCTVKMHRKQDYGGRFYIQKVRVCRMAGDA